MMRTIGSPGFVRALVLAVALLPAGSATDRAGTTAPTLDDVTVTPVAAPTLDDGAVRISYRLGPAGSSANVVIQIRRGGCTLSNLVAETGSGRAEPYVHAWSGRLESGTYAPTGVYEVAIEATAPGAPPVKHVQAVEIIRVGVAAMQATGEKVQMVYFVPDPGTGEADRFYLTPKIHEYYAGPASALWGPMGAPLGALALHTDPIRPRMNGVHIAQKGYNYPVCHVAGTEPGLFALLGVYSRDAAGVETFEAPLGLEIRPRLAEPILGDWTLVTSQSAVDPSGRRVIVAQFKGPRLPLICRRRDLHMTWSWEARRAGGPWFTIPGHLEMNRRIYTVVGKPTLPGAAARKQERGVWVAVVERFETWRNGIGPPNDPTTQADVVRAIVLGLHLNVGVPAASPGHLTYNCGAQCGAWGPAYYYRTLDDMGGPASRPALGSCADPVATPCVIELSALLNGAGYGNLVDCSDVAGAAGAVMAMLGVADVRLLRVCNPTQQALRVIGSSAYTLNVFDPAKLLPEVLTYHHLNIRGGGGLVSDACFSVDMDGNPMTLGGTPGFNHDRPLAGPAANNYLSLAFAPPAPPAPLATVEDPLPALH